MPLLVCTLCGSGYASVGEVPPMCPACEKPTTWTNVPASPYEIKTISWTPPSGYQPPKPPYVLSENDRKCLRAMKILPN